jgi:hypothetical protein
VHGPARGDELPDSVAASRLTRVGLGQVLSEADRRFNSSTERSDTDSLINAIAKDGDPRRGDPPPVSQIGLAKSTDCGDEYRGDPTAVP